MYQNHREEFLDASDKVYKTGNVLGGEYTKQFERDMAKRCGRKYAVTTNSCTQALEFACRFNPRKSEPYSNSGNVYIPMVTFPATYNAARLAGRDVKFVDVDSEGLMDLSDLTTKADNITTILYVNLYGNVLDYDKLKVTAEFFDKKMYIIEDAAQSLGASYNGVPSGKLGNVSCLSFDPTKNLPNFGSGGMILCDTIDELSAFGDYRSNGKVNDYMNIGTNSRMSEADCAQMLVKLQYFDQWQARRKAIAEYYSDMLAGTVRIPRVEEKVVHAWHKYVIHTTTRHGLQHHLSGKGIETRIHYDRTLDQLDSAFDISTFHRNSNTANATSFVQTCLSLPIYPELLDSEVEFIAKQVKRHYQNS
jgi:dTDP-4-amino-4,6-dideoxygalactose transaminase